MDAIQLSVMGLCVLFSTVALVLSFLAKKEAHQAHLTASSYPGLTESVIRVVNQVKDECENMWDKVESHLGRISRAKASGPKLPQIDIEKLNQAAKMAEHVDGQDGPIMSNYPPPEEGGGSPRQALLARAQRR